MPSNELETIAASIQDALHRAYALGRNDALRRVVEMVQADELGSKTVALLGHSETPATETPRLNQHVEEQHIENGHVDDQPVAADPIHLSHVQPDAAPAEAVRHDGAERADAPPQGERILARPGSMGSFLLDYIYPINAKK